MPRYLISLLDRTILVTFGILIGIFMVEINKQQFKPAPFTKKEVMYLTCMEGHRSNTMITIESLDDGL